MIVAPKTKIVLTKSIANITALLLAIAASGLTTEYDLLRAGIALGMIGLAILSFAQRYREWGAVFIALVILFNPIWPYAHLAKNVWVILDVLLIACVVYFVWHTTNPHQKGTRFEAYVAALFPEPHFTIRDRTRDISKFSHRIVESDSHPDFTFRNNKTGNIFAVECKWNARWWKGAREDGLLWKQKNTYHYRAFEKEKSIPVIIALGVGDRPESPRETYFVKLDDIRGQFIPKTQLINSRLSIYDL